MSHMRRAMFRKNFRVKLGDPDRNDVAYSQAVLDMTILRGIANEDVVPRHCEIQRDRADKLLKMLNGNWKSTLIVHHCSYGCCRNNQAAWQKYVTLRDVHVGTVALAWCVRCVRQNRFKDQL